MTKRLSRRQFLRGAGLTTVAVAAAACGTKAKPTIKAEVLATIVPEKKEEITVWASNDIQWTYWKPLVEKFMAKHPDFGHEIKFQHITGGANEKLTAALVAGRGAPDTMVVPAPLMSGFFKGGMARDVLHDLRPRLLEDFPNYDKDFAKWHPNTDADGGVYGIEIGVSPTVYYYRKDLHDAAGVDPTTYVTYEDLIRGGKEFNEFHPGKFSMVADIGGTDSLRILATQNGGGYFDKDGNILLDSDANIEALQLLYDMAVVEKMAWPCSNVWGPGMWAALEDGTAAGNIGADWYGGSLLRSKVPNLAGKWAVTKMPAFRPGEAISAQFGGGAHCITKQSGAPDAVWELIKYVLMSKEGQIFRYEAVAQFPTRLDVMNDPRIVDVEDPFFGGQKVGALLAEVAPSSVELPAHPFLPEAMNLLRTAVEPVISGKKTPAVALGDAADELRDLVAQG